MSPIKVKAMLIHTVLVYGTVPDHLIIIIIFYCEANTWTITSHSAAESNSEMWGREHNKPV